MNVMVTAGGKLVFLDFDRARKKLLGLKDVESMVWRLDRFVDKMGRQGKLAVQQREKTLFLRTYDRLSHRGLTTRMQSRAAAKTRLHRIGWFFESLLYGKQ
jgi:alpha-galactosidase